MKNTKENSNSGIRFNHEAFGIAVAATGPEPRRTIRRKPITACGIVFLCAFSFPRPSWSQTAPADSAVSAVSSPVRRGADRADSTLNFLTDSLTSARASGDRGLEARHLSSIGRLLYSRRNYAEAERMLTRGRRIAEQIRDRARLRDIYQSLSETVAAQEDYPAALRYHRLYGSLKDSLADEYLRQQINEMEAGYRMESETRETAHLNREKGLERTTDGLRKAALAAAALAGLLAAVLGFVFFRGRRRERLLTAELNDATGRIARLDRFKQGITALMTPEFSNPLNAILVHTEGADDRPRLAVRQAARQMLNQVANVLDMQKFENGEMKMAPENIRLRVPAEQAVEDVIFLAGEKGMNIHNDIIRTLSVWADAAVIRRVLTNLLVHAVKYSNTGGEIWVKAISGDGDFIRVSVNYTGEGLTPEQREKAFEEFGRIEAGHSGKSRLTGLGPAFCRRAVEALGGKIAAESEPGRGNSFGFTLAKARTPLNGETAQSAGSRPDPGLRKTAVLRDEDRKKWRSALKRLDDLGYGDLDEIRKCLNLIDDSAPELKRWKDEVYAAAFACDEVRFRGLIKE